MIGIPLWLVVVTVRASRRARPSTRPVAAVHAGSCRDNSPGDAFTDGGVIRRSSAACSIVVPSVVGVLMFGSMAAWVLARRKRAWLATCSTPSAISGIVLPPAVITLVLLLRQIGLAGTVAGMVLVYVGIYLSTVIFFITGFVRTIPQALEEAARVDGARPVRGLPPDRAAAAAAGAGHRDDPDLPVHLERRVLRLLRGRRPASTPCR